MSSNYGVCNICKRAIYKPLECEVCGHDICPGCMQGYSNICKECYAKHKPSTAEDTLLELIKLTIISKERYAAMYDSTRADEWDSEDHHYAMGVVAMCNSIMEKYDKCVEGQMDEKKSEEISEEISEDSKTLHNIDEFAKQELDTINKRGEEDIYDYMRGMRSAYNKILTIMWGEKPEPYLFNRELTPAEVKNNYDAQEIGDHPVFQGNIFQGNPDDCAFSHKTQSDILNKKLQILQDQIDTLRQCIRNLH